MEATMEFDQQPEAQEKAPVPAQPQAAPQPEAQEVSYEDAKLDQAEDPPAPQQAPPAEDVVDLLKPKKAAKKWVIGPEGHEREYVQRPLSFIAKMQWFALVGDVVDRAMSGEDRLTLGNLFSAPEGRGGSLRAEDFRDADTFVQAVGKLLVHAPDFLVKSYCIWLGVPDYERDLARQLMELPPDQGGLSDEDGIEIIETFIDQNYEALDRFFRELLGRLQKRVQARAEEAQSSRQSRR